MRTLSSMRRESFIIFQFEETVCNILSYKILKRGFRKQIDGFWSLTYEHLEEKNVISQKLKELLKEINPAKNTILKENNTIVSNRANYFHQRVIMVISHKRVSSRFIKLPSIDKREIEEMVYLQTTKDLPYTSEELVIGYQIVSCDKEKISSINMIFSRRDIIAGLLDIFREQGLEVEAVFLSTYGIGGLFNTLMPKELNEVLVVNTESDGLEIIVLNKGKVFLSRFINISKQESGWQQDMFKQIMETQSLYLKSGSFGPLKKVFLMADAQSINDCKIILDEKMLIPVQTLRLPDNLFGIDVRQEAVRQVPICLWGFLLNRPAESLNLLPREVKKIRYELKQKRLSLRLLFISIATVFIMVFAFSSYTRNKKAYLGYLDKELKKIEGEAKELESMIKQLGIFKDKRKVSFELLDYFVAIHKVIPPAMLINSVTYDSKEKEGLCIRGYSEKLDTVFSYASNLREIDVFKQGEIKVKQTSNKVTRDGEVVSFEIVFLKKGDRLLF